MTYASRSPTPVATTIQEIQKTLTRYGADHFGYATAPGKAIVMFQAHGRQVRFTLPLDPPGCHTEKEEGQFHRSRWRCLLLSIKAKLEAVESGISSFEVEFLPFTLLPNGQTVADHALPFVRKAYETKSMPPLLGYGS